MGDYNIGGGLGAVIITLCVICVVVFLGGYLLIDKLFVDHNIRSKKPIKPDGN